MSEGPEGHLFKIRWYRDTSDPSGAEGASLGGGLPPRQNRVKDQSRSYLVGDGLLPKLLKGPEVPIQPPNHGFPLLLREIQAGDLLRLGQVLGSNLAFLL